MIDTYGMTEAASQIAANPLERRKPGSVGKSAGAEIAIMDERGRRLPTGERGEITLRGPTITRGYDDNAAANEAAFRDGWFRTGDLGYLDRDGYLFIVGRIKDVINRGGQKVAPGEVEEALLSHPDVIEAVAFSGFPSATWRGRGRRRRIASRLQGYSAQASSLRPRTPGQVQSPWPDPFCGGDPKGPERKDQARRTGSRRFNDARQARASNTAAR